MSAAFDARSPRDPRLQQVLDRAATDPAFRARLLAEPHAAIRDAFGVRIPEGFRIKFVERGAEVDALIVLPNAVRPAAEDGELDDASLEAVAGGRGGAGGGWADAGAAKAWNGDGWNDWVQ